MIPWVEGNKKKNNLQNKFCLAVGVHPDNAWRTSKPGRTPVTLLYLPMANGIWFFVTMFDIMRYQTTHALPNGIYLLNNVECLSPLKSYRTQSRKHAETMFGLWRSRLMTNAGDTDLSAFVINIPKPSRQQTWLLPGKFLSLSLSSSALCELLYFFSRAFLSFFFLWCLQCKMGQN